MKPIPRSHHLDSLRTFGALSRPHTSRLLPLQRCLHTSPPIPASVNPAGITGPPPTVPLPSAEYVDARVARRRKQAELIKRGVELRAGTNPNAKGSLKTKRFWKDVHVKKVDGGLEIHLDSRPVRTASKQIITIPHHKPHLAHAIALEWDLLVSAQQGLKTHLIPLTSLVSRAIDIENDDKAAPDGQGSVRKNISQMVMRYLETDTLLCWAPPASPDPPGYETHVDRTEGLRDIQIRTAQPIIAYLTQKVWPGVEIVPVLDGESIMPRSQPEMTKQVIEGWVRGLPAWELAGLERGVLAGKGLLGAARLVVEWSTELAHLRGEDGEGGERFGIEEAAHAASLEVKYQTDMWGEVEDTHDVEKEDLKRQLGSVILLVSGEKV